MWEENVPAPSFELPITDALYAAYHAATIEAEGIELGSPMTATQALYARHFVHHVDGMPISELARRTGTSTANASQLASRMERHGLVVRERHPYDRRSWLISLTDSGVAQYLLLARGWQQRDRQLAARSRRAHAQVLIAGLREVGDAPRWDRETTRWG